MKIHIPAFAAAAVLVWGAFQPASAQLPKIDKVRVTLPYKVMAGEKTLPAGDYTIEQQPTDGDSRVLMIYNSSGFKLQAMAMTTRSVEPKSPSQSTVSLLHYGKIYYLDKVWLEGNRWGYVIALPEKVRSHEKDMETVVLPATTGQ